MFKLSKIGSVTSNFTARSRGFISNRDGNVGMTFSLMLLPLLVVIGGAVDYTKMSREVSAGQDSADAAVLHAAHEYYKNFSRGSAKDIGDLASSYHLDSNGAIDDYLVETVVAESTANSLTLKTTVSGTSQHAFMGMVGNPETAWTATSYSVVSIPQIEIMLVMDVSASMKGVKLERLKQSLDTFIENVDPYRRGESHISITLLPYAETINFGLGASAWLHPSNSAAFEGCFVQTETDLKGALTPYAIGGLGGQFNLPLCPPVTSEAVLFSTDGDNLRTQVAGMELGFGTHTTRGLLWAERLLDNTWRNSASSFSANTPITLTDDTHKIVVLLTDGRFTVTDLDQDGNTQEAQNGAIAKADFTAQCQAFGNYPNLDLYAVAYDLENGNFKNLLSSCVSGNGEYFEAEINDLDEVFKKVEESLSPIRISR